MSHSFSGVLSNNYKTNIDTNNIAIPADGPQVKFNSSGLLPLYTEPVISPLKVHDVAAVGDLVNNPTHQFVSGAYFTAAALTLPPVMFTPYRRYLQFTAATGGTVITFPDADEWIAYLKTLMGDSNVLANMAWEMTIINQAVPEADVITFVAGANVNFVGGVPRVFAKDIVANTNPNPVTAKRILCKVREIQPTPTMTVTFF